MNLTDLLGSVKFLEYGGRCDRRAGLVQWRAGAGLAPPVRVVLSQPAGSGPDNERELAERVAAIGPVADGSMGVDQVGACLRAEHQRWAAAAREIVCCPVKGAMHR